MIRAFYFGYLEGSGHFFRDGHGNSTLDARRLVPEFPAAWDRLLDTGLLKNGKVPDHPDGTVYWTCADNRWQAFVWWDRSGDKRGASNSGFYVQGFELLQIRAAFDFACNAYPEVVARQLHPLRLKS